MGGPGGNGGCGGNDGGFGRSGGGTAAVSMSCTSVLPPPQCKSQACSPRGGCLSELNSDRRKHSVHHHPNRNLWWRSGLPHRGPTWKNRWRTLHHRCSPDRNTVTRCCQPAHSTEHRSCRRRPGRRCHRVKLRMSRYLAHQQGQAWRSTLKGKLVVEPILLSA